MGGRAGALALQCTMQSPSPGTGWMYEPMGQHCCTARQKATMRSLLPSSTAAVAQSRRRVVSNAAELQVATMSRAAQLQGAERCVCAWHGQQAGKAEP